MAHEERAREWLEATDRRAPDDSSDLDSLTALLDRVADEARREEADTIYDNWAARSDDDFRVWLIGRGKV